MDRSTKERLTGAIVLVAVAWLVIPVFLDGPDEQGERPRQQVDLPGQQGQPTRTKTIVLNPPRESADSAERVTDPAPVTRRLPVQEGSAGAEPAESVAPGEGALSESAESPAEKSAPAPAAKQPEPAESAAAPPAAAAEDAPGGAAASESLWAVQLGSFSRKDNAEGLASDLRKEGFAAFLSDVDAGGRELHRVRVGPQGSREEAEKVAAALKAAGHAGQVVSHP